MDRETAGRILVGEDRAASVEYCRYAMDIAAQAAERIRQIADAPVVDVLVTAGAAEAAALLGNVQWWEFTAGTDYLSTTHGFSSRIRHLWRANPTFPPGAGATLHETRSRLVDLEQALRAAASADSVLIVPNFEPPSRHARLKPGLNARVLKDELADSVDRGRELSRMPVRPATAPTEVEHWVMCVSNLLDGFEVSSGSPCFTDQFGGLIEGVAAARSPLVAESAQLTRAYLALGITYLEEVHGQMSDYAETSGQSERDPSFRLDISGGTFYGGMFGAKIMNIDSTILTIAQQGDGRTADALKAIEHAVLAEPELDDQSRQELLETVEYLAQSAEQPPEKRSRGMVKSALAALGVAATAGTELNKAMEAWGQVLGGVLPS
ncbi:hypothetical protein AB0N05_17400 [Nocardia sp. NPDC051030]|uniref:hypothetical protein n=1 Tax=Nocardia sp. NPDC051030 TaxID=3155162 RepID=UPI00342851AA